MEGSNGEPDYKEALARLQALEDMKKEDGGGGKKNGRAVTPGFGNIAFKDNGASASTLKLAHPHGYFTGRKIAPKKGAE